MLCFLASHGPISTMQRKRNLDKFYSLESPKSSLISTIAANKKVLRAAYAGQYEKYSELPIRNQI